MTTTEMIDVMQAFENGKDIEFKHKLASEWYDVYNPRWNWDMYEYRIKREPSREPMTKYKPYDNVTEIERDKWVKQKDCELLHRIDSINLIKQRVFIFDHWVDLTELFEDFEYEDGSPCGKKEKLE